MASPPDERPLRADDITTRDQWAAALTALRQEAALTVRALARRAGMPPSTVGGYLTGRHLPPPTRPDDLDRLLIALGVPSADRPAWQSALRRIHALRTQRPAGDRRPFLGLAPFGLADADLFFGRGEEVDRLLPLVTDADGSVVAVVGASGSGKTSLIHAGLVPALPRSWRVVSLTPGAAPTAALDQALAALTDADPAAPTLVVVDQLEELWTLGAPEPERTAFLERVAALARMPRRHVIVGLRSDFFGQAGDNEALVDALAENYFVVRPLGRAALTEAVTGPAAAIGVAVQGGLVDQLVRDALAGGRDRAVVLPHLSHTLARMWERNRAELTLADYAAVGRLAGAVAQSAEDAWQAVPPADRQTARDMLLRLVVVEEGAPPTSGVVRLDRMTAADRSAIAPFVERRLLSLGESEVRVAHEAVLTAWDRLAGWIDQDRGRLLVRRTVNREARAWDAAGQDPGVLLRGARLAAARELGTAIPGLRQDFVAASIEADDQRQRRARRAQRRTRRFFLATAVLAVAALAASGGLVASRMTISSERSAAQSRQIGAEALARGARDPITAGQLAVAALALDNTVEARSMVAAAAGKPATHALAGPGGATFSAVAPKTGLLALGGTGTRVLLYDATDAQPRRVAEVPAPGDDESSIFALAFSPDGTRLAVAGTAGLVRVVDVTTPAAPRALGPDLVIPAQEAVRTAYAVAFSPDGSTLYATSPSSGVLRWRLRDAGTAEALPALAASGFTTALAVLPNGRIASSNTQGELQLWNPARPGTPERRWKVGGAQMMGVAAVDGSLVVGSRSPNEAWAIPMESTPDAAPVLLARFQSWATSVAANPARPFVAIGSSERTVLLIDPRGREYGRLRTVDPVSSVTWLDDTRLVIGTNNGLAQVRAVQLPVSENPASGVFAVGWSGDGRRLAIFPSSYPGRVTLWNTEHPQKPQPLAVITPTNPAQGLAGTGDLSPDGRTLVAGTSDGQVIGWDVTEPTRPRQLFAVDVVRDIPADQDRTVEYVTFAGPDRVVVGTDAAQVQVLRLQGDQPPTTVATLIGPANHVSSVDLSSDGSLVAATDLNGETHLWPLDEAATEPTKAIAAIPGAGVAYTVRFLQGGRRVAVAGEDGRIRLYDVSDPRHPVPSGTLTGPMGGVYMLDVAADGRLAAAVQDGTVFVWAPGAGGDFEVTHRMPGEGQRYTVRFSPDGTQLVGAGQAGVVEILPLDPATGIALLCADLGQPLTAEHWALMLPDLTFRQPCP